MALKFNPFTGTLDLVSDESGLVLQDVVDNSGAPAQLDLDLLDSGSGRDLEIDANGALAFKISQSNGLVDIGSPGTETSGINVNGTVYDLGLRINDVNGSATPGLLHLLKHSTTLPGIMVMSRSNSNDSSHGTVTSGQQLGRIVGTGWTGSHYDVFGDIIIGADDSGTIGSTSSPGRILFRTTTDSAQTPTTALEIDNEQNSFFSGDITLNNTVSWTFSTSASDITLMPSTINPVLNKFSLNAPIDLNYSFSTTATAEYGTLANVSGTYTFPSNAFNFNYMIFSNVTYDISNLVWNHGALLAKNIYNFSAECFGTYNLFSSESKINITGNNGLPNVIIFRDATTTLASTASGPSTKLYKSFHSQVTVSANASLSGTYSQIDAFVADFRVTAASGGTAGTSEYNSFRVGTPTATGAGTKIITAHNGLYLPASSPATNFFGIRSKVLSNSGANAFFYHTGTAHGIIGSDTARLQFGAGFDSEIGFNGANFIIDPDLVGSGRVYIGATGDDDMLLNSIEIDGDLNHDGANIGFYGVAPVARPAAYTQTYATATRTHAALTSATLTDITGGTANTTLVAISGSGDDANINNNFADLAAQVNALRVDIENAKQVLNQVIDDDQLQGLKQ